MISDDIRWYQMISDDFSDASVLSSSKCQCQRWIELKFPSFGQVQNFAGSTLPDNPAAMVPNVLIRMVQIPDMVHRAARQRQKNDNHIFCQKISSDLISSFFWINQQRYPGPAPHLWYRDVNTLTAWFQLEEMDPIGGKGSKFVPHVSQKKHGLKQLQQSYWNSPTHPPRVFSRFKTQGQK